MLRVYSFNTMNIEKTYKLTIKDTSFYLDATEINALYNECGKALNIGVTDSPYPNYPPGVRKFDPVVPTYPNWPTYPYPTHCGDMPFGTTTSGTADHSVMDTGNGLGIKSANVPSSKGINFVKDDMTTDTTDNFGFDWNTGKTNFNWRSSVQKALDKLSAKTNITTKLNGKTNITTNDGTKVG
jgi:hypothetical protein